MNVAHEGTDQLAQVIEVLRGSRLFQSVDLSLIDAELRASHTQNLRAGQVLIDPLHGNDDIFIVLAGELLVCLEPRIANPLVRLSAGDCVGELSIIDASLPSAYVVSAIETQVLAIAKSLLWRMLTLQQVMALNLLHILSLRIRDNNAMLLGSLALQREYRNKAETDTLTRLRNRAWFEEVFPKQLELCERIGQSACLLMVDIDHFKKVNDHYGHTYGDEALRHVGNLLRCNLRSTDLCARYGGEEMIALMPGTDVAQAKLMADRLRESIANTPLLLSDGRQLDLRVSGGISQWQPGIRMVDLIRSADQALYRAKEGGRNQIQVNPLPNEIGQD